MDLATILGLLVAWGALIGSLLMEGGDARALINIPAALLVFGGTLGAATVSFRMEQIRSLPDILRQAFREPGRDPGDVIRLLVRFSERARREGLLTLEAESRRLEDPFLQKAVRLAIDGLDPDDLRVILETEIEFLRARHRIGESMFITLGGFAPTLGIIGTVMGLIHMLANLSDPGKMGPLIAGAFIATLYGVSSANLLFLPLANKLRGRSQEEALICGIMIEGVLAIQAGDNPRIVDEKLKSFLAPRLRQTLAGVSSGSPSASRRAA